MRNPERLNLFYHELFLYHKTYFPDLRFGQFIMNFEYWYKNKTNRDIFYLEEFEFLKLLYEFATSKVNKI